jgi:hypothetical protein
MIQKQITFFGYQLILACDANCQKAWGINTRPKILFPPDEDDYAFLADGELGIAPMNTGTYEGGCAKPYPENLLNKWCARECERGVMVPVGDAILLPDFSKRRYNMPSKHTGDSV